MRSALVLAASLVAGSAAAQSATVEMHKVSADGVGERIGTVELADEAGGLMLTPDLQGLDPGPHGFHVHEKPSCEPGESEGEPAAAMAAGSHYDPENTETHAGPYGEGHQGDLPILYVRADGTATDAVLAPRLSVEDVRGRSLMVHEGGDNYEDEPENGGGGARIACGVIPD